MKEDNAVKKPKSVGRLRYIGSFQTAAVGIAVPAIALLILLGGILVFCFKPGIEGGYVLAASTVLLGFLLLYLFKAKNALYAFARFERRGIRLYFPFRKPFYFLYRDVKYAGAAVTRLAQDTVREKHATVWIYLSAVPIRPHVLRNIAELQNGAESIRFPYDEEVFSLLSEELPGDASAALRRELRRINRKEGKGEEEIAAE